MVRAVALLLSVLPAAAAPWCQIITPAGTPPLVRQAATELAAGLSRRTDADIALRQVPLPGLRAVLLRVDASAPFGDEEYQLSPDGADRVVIRGRTPLAIQHGTYRLLREYGCGSYFDGDAVPLAQPVAWLTPSVRAAPVFAVRGSLPWYNFLDSPTTWDAQDFRHLADQLIRSGQNFVGFHTYDYEPFAAYTDGGRVLGGEPLLTTEQRIWGTFPLKVAEFGFGTGRFFGGTWWGGDVARLPGSREERLLRQKALLAEGLAYASARGVKTCLGFEVSGDPTDPAEQRRFRARLTQLVRDYPMLDYVWLWQPEGMSMQGTAPPPLRSQGGRVVRDWTAAFATISDPKRAWEGMRVAGYGQLARTILDGAAPEVKLVLSGWGGDHWLHVSDYFPAWDRVLDPRIIFAALDDIRVSPTVSAGYRLSANRERWAIPWYEYDGDQWSPQANAAIFAQTVRDARAKGCQGLLAIHWRTKEVGESQALCAQYAWRDGESLADFYRDYGQRRVGPRHGAAFGQALQELDALGYRWLGGAGQTECGEFAWTTVADPAREATLLAIAQRLRALRAAVIAQPAATGALGRIDDTVATIDRQLGYNRFAALLVPGGAVDQALASTGDARREATGKLLDRLAGPEFGEVLDGYARTITSRGELGVLATVNGKAFHQLCAAVRRLAEAAGRPVPDLTAANPAHRGLVSDYQLTSVAAGQPLPVRCVAYAGDRPARRVTLLRRGPADGGWVAQPLSRTERCLFETVIPPEAVQPGWLRYRLTAELPDGQQLDWPALRGEPYRQVTVFATTALVPRRNQVTTAPPRPPATATLRVVAAPLAVRLTWGAWSGAPSVTVQRRTGEAPWQTLGATADQQFEDTTAPPAAVLGYRLLGSDELTLAAATVTTPPAPAPAAPRELVARPRGPAVRLRWSGGDLTVTHYRVERAAAVGGPFAPVNGLAPLLPDGSGENDATDRPRRDGRLWYRVVAQGRGEATSICEPVAVNVSSTVPKPVVNLEFDSPAAGRSVEYSGPHQLLTVDGRGVLRTDGGLALPFDESLAMKGPFTAAIRFRMREATPIPVLLGQGAWQGPGWFVQSIGPSLRFYVGGAGCLDCPWQAHLGQWHTVVCVYDGDSLAAYADGRLLGEQRAQGRPRTGRHPFTVGRYCEPGLPWKLIGDLDFARLYDQPLEPDLVMRANAGPFAPTVLDWTAAPAGDWRQDRTLVTTPHGRGLALDGGVVLPVDEAHIVADGFEVLTSFRLRRVDGMPVLLNQGLWPDEGWMVQVLGKRLRLHVGGAGSLDCDPELAAGRWYRLRFTYDGTTARAWLDGQLIGEQALSQPLTPSLRPLRVGCYELDEPVYVAHGELGPTEIRPAP